MGNVHPCLREPYGLTPVEAAACHTPSLVQRTDVSRQLGVGAAVLLREDEEGNADGKGKGCFPIEYGDERGTLEELNLVPLVCGAEAKDKHGVISEYAKGVKERLE